MGRSNPQSLAKRRREREKIEKRQAKDERRAARKAERDAKTESAITDSGPSIES